MAIDRMGQTPKEFLEEKIGEKKEKTEEDKAKEIREKRGEKVENYLLNEIHSDVIVGEKEVKEDKKLNEKDREYRELEKDDAEKCIKTLSKVYDIEVTDEIIKELNLDEKGELKNFEGLENDIVASVLEIGQEKKLRKNTEELFYKILERKLGVVEVKETLKEIMDSFRDLVNMEESELAFLVYGNAAMDNIHVNKDGEPKIKRWVHTTYSKNKALAFIFDYGNLRGRAAGNPDFQEALDASIMEEFKDNPKLGEAVVALATLRTSLKFFKYAEGGADFKKGQVDNHIDNIKKFFPSARLKEAKS